MNNTFEAKFIFQEMGIFKYFVSYHYSFAGGSHGHGMIEMRSGFEVKKFEHVKKIADWISKDISKNNNGVEVTVIILNYKRLEEYE